MPGRKVFPKCVYGRKVRWKVDESRSRYLVEGLGRYIETGEIAVTGVEWQGKWHGVERR